eukprot:6157167-Pleurochrysis_carterae.AAC.2
MQNDVLPTPSPKACVCSVSRRPGPAISHQRLSRAPRVSGRARASRSTRASTASRPSAAASAAPAWRRPPPPPSG